MDILYRHLAGWCICLLLSPLAPALAEEVDLRLIEAAKAQDWEGVQTLLDKGNLGVINNRQPDGSSALAWSVYWDDLETVKLLLRSGSDPNLANDHGLTPLFLGIKNRSPAVVSALLEGSADPNASLWNGVTPLMIAAKTGVTGIIESLLTHQADINTRDYRRGQNALMWAIGFEQPDIARILIENGADISTGTKMLDDDEFTPMVVDGYMENVVVTPRGGYTPLMFAARVGDMDTARLLLDRGADVNKIHANEGSALVIAAAGGYEDLAGYLLEQGGDPNVTDASGMTALHYAMRDGLRVLHDLAIGNVTQICGYGDEVFLRCKPLELATQQELATLEEPNSRLFTRKPKKDPNEPLPGSNMYKLAEKLLSYGADPNARIKYPPPRLRLFPTKNSMFDTKGATPFFLAVAAMDLRATEMLLEHGADPLIGTEINEERLIKETKAVRDVNQTVGNATPLMVAAGIGRRVALYPAEEDRAIKIASKLLDMGADINAYTATGWTALHAAAFIGANKLIKFLVNNGAELNVPNGCDQTPLDLAIGEETKGLLDYPTFRESTANLLISLGANLNRHSDSVGRCVLGRPELDRLVETDKRIQAFREANQAKN